MAEGISNAKDLRAGLRRHRSRLCLGTALALASVVMARPAFAADACTPTAPANGQTVTCEGAASVGVIADASTDVTVNVLAGASVAPTSGPAIWLGGNADIDVDIGATLGSDSANSYAVLLGDGSTVMLEGTIRGRGGITGPTQVSGSTGLAGAYITLNAGSQIITNGSALNAAIDGRAGGNTYLVDGAIRATGTSGQGIRPGNGDIITIGSTGSITTLSGDSSNPIDGFQKTGVTVLTSVGSLIELHGIGEGIQLGDNADVTLAGTIRSFGDAPIANSAGGAGVWVGANSTVRLLSTGSIVTGNIQNLGNKGSGGTGISTFNSEMPSNATVIVDGLIDTQLAQGIFGGIGDTLTVGATGRITSRGNARTLFYNTHTSVGNGTLTIDIGGNVEQLGTATALFISASRAQGETVETPVTANVTIREGGRLHAAGNTAYGQDDGAGTYPEVIDNLVVAGTVSRGNAGVAIDLNDGADRVTFLPTYALTGDVDGGTDPAQAAEIDTFALDGGQGTSATFDFGLNQIRNFEAGEKLGAGSWRLAGDSGGLAGIFAVQQGMLTVDGVMSNTGVTVASGATLGGGGAFGGAGTIADGGILTGTAGAGLGFGSLLLNPASLINVMLGAPSTAALFDITGALTLDGLLNVADGGGFALGSYRLFDHGGALTDNGLTIQSLPTGFNPGDWSIDTATAGQVNLIVAAGPGEQYWDGTNLTPGNVANGRGGTAVWNATSTNWTNQAGSINAPWAGGVAIFGPCPGNACVFGSGTSPSYTVTIDAGGVSATGLRTLNVPVTLTGGTITLADGARIDVMQPDSSGAATLNGRGVIHATGDLIKGGMGSFFFTGQTQVDGGLTVEQGVMMATDATAALNVAGAVTVGGAGTDAFPTRLLASGGAKLTSAGGSVGGAAGTAGSIFIQRGGTWDAGTGTIDVGASGVGVLRVYSSLIDAVSEIKAGEIVLGRNAGGNGKLQLWGDDSDGIITATTVRGGVGGGSVEFDNLNSTPAFVFTPLMTGNLSATFLSGATTLRGINDYTGATLVNGGKLFLDGASLTGSAVTVQRGTLGGAGAIAGAVSFAATNTILQGAAGQSLAMGSLVLGSGTAVNVTLGAPSASALFDITGALTLDGLLNVTDGGGFTYGAYRLFDHGGTLTDNGLTIQTLPTGFNPGDWSIDTATAGQVNLRVAQGPGEQYWDGSNLTPGNVAEGRGGSGTWNAANTNWTNQAGSINAPWAGGTAVFANGGGTFGTFPAVTVDGAIQVAGLRFTTPGNYRLTGTGSLDLADGATISAAGATSIDIRLNALGDLAFEGSSIDLGLRGESVAAAGDLTIRPGQLVLNMGDLAAGAPATAVTVGGSLNVLGGRLDIRRSASVTSAGGLLDGASGDSDGTASLVGGQWNAGDLLTIADGGAGGLGISGTVTAGEVRVASQAGSSGYLSTTISGFGTFGDNGTLNAASVTFGAGQGRLQGFGTITGLVTMSNTSTLVGVGGVAGPADQTMTLGGLVLAQGTHIDVTLGAPNNNALFDVTGGLTLDGLLNVADGGGFTYGAYRLFDYGGTLTDNGLTIQSLPTGFNPGDWTIDTATAGRVTLNVLQGDGDQYWDGANMAPGGVADGRGGSGVWNATNTNWANQAGTINAPWAGQKAVFARAANNAPGTVTVVGAQGFTALRFLSGSHYDIVAGANGTLVTGAGQAAVTVEQAAQDYSGITISAPISGAGGIDKKGAGTLILRGAHSYSGGTVVSDGTLQIGDGSGAGSIVGTVATLGGGTAGAMGGEIVYFSNSSAGSASFTNNGASAVGAHAGLTAFYDDATAANATIVNIGNSVAGGVGGGDFDQPFEYGGATAFYEDSNAGSASITNRGSTVAGAYGGGVGFADSASAGNAVITNLGSTTAGAFGGATVFINESSAGNATLIADGGTGGGGGGGIVFAEDSQGGTAKIRIYGNGALDISPHAGVGVTVGSIEGDGLVLLGGRRLSVGGGNASTVFSGTMMNGGLYGGTGGSLEKLGTGALTFAGTGAYSGGTIVRAGSLLVDGALAGTSGTTVSAGATLGGAGTIAGVTAIADGGTLLGRAGADLGLASLVLNPSSLVKVTLGAPGNAALFDITGGLTLDGLLNVADGGGFTYGAYRLFDYGGTLTDNGLTIQSLPTGFNPGDWTIDTATAGQVTLNVLQGDGDQYWDGANMAPGGVANGRGGSGVWNAANTNWTNQAGTINAPWAGQKAVFASVVGDAAVQVAGEQAVTGLRFLAPVAGANGYRFTAGAGGALLLAGQTPFDVAGATGGAVTEADIAVEIRGAGGVVKTGTGDLTLGAANSYGGGTRIEQGLLTARANGALGSGPVTVAGGTLAFAGANAGALAIANQGAGTLSFLTGSDAGSATIANAGLVRFAGSANAAGAAIDNQAGGVVDVSARDGAGELAIGSLGGMGTVRLGARTLALGGLGGDAVIGGVVEGAGGGLVKTGAGMLTLAGANSYDGLTTLRAGTLRVTGSIAGGLAATGGSLGGTGLIGGDAVIGGANLLGASGALLRFGGSLALSAGSNVDVVLGAPGAGALFDVGGDLVLDGALNVTAGAGFGLGSYRLFDYGGALTDNGLVIAAVPAGYNPGDWGIFTAQPGQVDLIVAQAAGEQYWDGANMAPGGVANGRGGSGVWNAANTNWTNQAGTINAPWAGQKAVFAAAGASTVTIQGNQTVTGLRFMSGADYSFAAGAQGGLTLSGAAQLVLEQQGGDTTTARIAAPIGGSGALVKSGAGTLILSGANSYAGGTTIGAGTLRIGDGGTAGSVAGDIVNQGVLAFDRSDASAFGGAISGSGSVVKAGAGTLTLTGAATHGGGTTIAAGTLRIGAGGSLGGDAGIAAGATLAFERADAISHGGAISGTGALVQAGAGTLKLTGNSGGFGGATTVQAGGLELAGTLGGALSVSSGALLGGSGTATGAVSIAAGGTLAGRSGATLGLGSLVLAEGAVVNAALGAPGGNGLFAVAGDLVLDGTLKVSDAGGYGLGVYRLFDYGGALTDNGLAIGQRPQAGDSDAMVQTGQAGQVNLVVTVRTGPDFVQFWNGTTTSPAGSVIGGSGTWTAGPLTNWTDPNGSTAYGWNGGFAVFQGAAGMVTAEVGVSAQGMQFAVDGYRLAGAPVTLAAPDMTAIRVGDGSAAGAAYRATISAALTGASGLEKQDLGTLILTGANDYAGGTHVAAGTLRIGDGGTTGSVTGDIANDGTLVFDRSDAVTFGGAVSGAGSLVKAGAGTLRLTGASSHGGATRVDAGTLAVDGSIAASAVTVASGATLAGNGTVGATRVAGTIAPGNSAGTLTIAGDYTQLAGSTYAYEPGDLIRVTGFADIQGGRVRAANVAGASYRLGDRSAILTATGGRGGAGYAGVDLASPLAQPFLTLGLTYDANSVYLQAVRNGVSFESAGLTFNQRAAARGIDGLTAASPLYTAMANAADLATARTGFDAASGEIHASLKGMLLDDGRHVREAVIGRLGQAAGEAGAGMWAQAVGSWGDWDGDGNAARFDRSIMGLLLGADADLGGGWRGGVTAGYSRSKADAAARASHAEADSVHAGAYIGGRWGGTSVQAGAALAWHDVSTRRGIGFTGFAETARADYDARGLQLFAEAGHRIALGDAGIEPFAGVAHARLRTSAFTEAGGAAALGAERRTESASWSTLGLRGDAPLGEGALLQGSIGWRHALSGRLPAADLSFGGGAAFTVLGTPLDKDAALITAGARFTLGKGATAGIGYTGAIGSAASDHGVRATVSFRF